jgi:hypothetical protein
MDFFIIFINTLGMTLGVGSSTYAITFFHQSIADGVIDDTEKRFLHTVYFLLRAGMILLFLSYTSQGYAIMHGLSIPVGNDTLAAQASFLAIIFGNAVLMDKRLIAMWLGPAIAGASWYSIFFASTLDMYHFPYSLLIDWYCILIILFILILRILRELMMKK